MITKPKKNHWYLIGWNDYIDSNVSKGIEFVIEPRQYNGQDTFYTADGVGISLDECIVISEIKISELPKSTVARYIKLLTAREDKKKSC